MPEKDDVSKIHDKYTLSLINPSSHYISLAASIVIAGLIGAFTASTYLGMTDLLFPTLGVIAALVGTQFLDILFAKHREYSKSFHVSLFGNSLFFVSTLIGYGAMGLFEKDGLDLFYVTMGMLFLQVSELEYLQRYLAQLEKSMGRCIHPTNGNVFGLVPSDMWISSLTNPWFILFGAAFLGLATAWSYLTDKAGRPGLRSTHELIQAYVTSMSRKDPTPLESIIEKSATESTVSTSQLRFQSSDKNDDFRIVLPDIHPGPFHPVGGSNITGLIYNDVTAMVMHSISNHDLNLPTQKDVQYYLKSLQESKAKQNEPYVQNQ